MSTIFRWPKDLLGTTNLHDIKEIFVWDGMSAPIQYRVGHGELEDPALMPSIPSAPGRPIAALRAPTYRHKPSLCS
jgi:hypothetical protein